MDICWYNDTSDISIKNGGEELDNSHLYIAVTTMVN
jgi:hypothetical protein